MEAKTINKIYAGYLAIGITLLLIAMYIGFVIGNELLAAIISGSVGVSSILFVGTMIYINRRKK